MVLVSLTSYFFLCILKCLRLALIHAYYREKVTLVLQHASACQTHWNNAASAVVMLLSRARNYESGFRSRGLNTCDNSCS